MNTQDLPSVSDEVILPKKPRRIPALDFTKGALVVIMVLYHWMNYFVIVDASVYKYLRFLTPSFIFITGFLVSQVYLSKYQISGIHIAGRLMLRGCKLLGIVLCLNIAIGAVGLKAFETRVGDWSPAGIVTAYVTGTAPIAFSVLVPIGYLLILSAGLLVASQRFGNIYYIASGAAVSFALLLEWKGINGGYLQIFSIGLLGTSVGHTSMNRINGLVRRPLPILVAYLVYLFAITLFNDVYSLQVVGVCLSLAIIYWIGIEKAETSRIGTLAILLGRYSLFAYIAQIVILQFLRRSLRPLGDGLGVSATAFVACLACTILSVDVLDRARKRIAALNKLYMAVFG